MTWEWRQSGVLKPGLPRLLAEDPQRLCEMLGVNRKQRRAQWSAASSDERTLVLEAIRDGSLGKVPEEVGLMAWRWSHPEFRRTGLEAALRGEPGPPSLLFSILRDFVEEDRRNKGAGSLGYTEAERSANRAWDHTWSRLHQWDELSELDREQCVLRLFAVATVLDQQGVLAEACRRIPALREEFGTMIPDEPDPMEEWARLCARLGELAQKAAGPPADPDRIFGIVEAAEDLQRIEPAVRDRVESANLESLLETVRAEVEAIAADSDLAWFDEELRAAVLGAWETIAPHLTLDEVGEERERFAAAVSPAMEAARETEAARSEAARRVREHREYRPASLGLRKTWVAALRELQTREQQREDELWQAQSALVAAVHPFGNAPDPDGDPEPPDPDGDPEPPAPTEDPDSSDADGPSEPGSLTDDFSEAGAAGDEPDEPEAKSPVAVDVGLPERKAGAAAPDARDGSEDDQTERAPDEAPSTPAAREEGESGGGDLEESESGKGRSVGADPTAGSEEGVVVDLSHLADDGDDEADGTDSRSAAVSGESPGEHGESDLEEATGPEERVETPPPDPLVARAEAALFEAIGEDPPRLAFAVQTTRLLEQEVPDGPPGRSELLEGVLLADRLRLADGEICTSLADVFGAFPDFDQGLDEDDQAFQIACRFSASLIPALIAPNSGAFAILRNLPSGPLPALRELAHGVSDHLAKLQTTHIGIHLLRRLRSDAVAEESRRQVGNEILQWRRDAPRRTMLYQPATAVWRHWLQESGWIGDLMRRIESGAESEAELRTRIRLLRSEDELQRRVTNTDRELRGRIGRRGAIRWRAFAQLVTEARKVADLAERYLDARTAVATGRDFRLTVLSALSREVDGRTQHVLAELQTARSQGPGWSSTGAGLAERAVQRLLDLLHGTGAEFEPIEPVPDELLASGFYGSRIVLDRHNEPRATSRDAIEALVGESAQSAAEAVRRHLDASELGMARRILDWSEGETGESLGELRSELARAREKRLDAARRRVQNLEDRMESGLILGTVSADQRSKLEGVFVEARRQLDRADFYRFDEIEGSLDRNDRRLTEMTREHVERVRSELADLALEEGTAARRAIERALAQYDIVSANELIGQVRKNPSFVPREPVSHHELFTDFFPEQEAATARALQQAGDSYRIIGAIRDGKPFPGVPSSLPGARRDSAVRMLEAWYSLKRHKRLSPMHSVVKQLFTELGFAVVALTASGGDAAKLSVAPLKSRQQCPVPRYGSAARGHYRVILQWGRPPIADLMQYADLDGGDPPILLYFGRLSTRQREELARESRRDASALLVLDETVLVSLCGERGSRLPALFHRTLPFTYTQPFKTTGGEVPPEMFYGRSQEKRDVASPNGPCFIYGGRQLGKTAILRAVRSAADDPRNGRYACFIDLKAYGIGVGRDVGDLWPLLWKELSRNGAIPVDVGEPAPKNRKSVTNFLDGLIKHFAQDSGRRLLLLLDEADRFLEVDAREQEKGVAASGYPQSIRLKRLMDETNRSIKIVFAGLHNVLRTAERANHPLGQFGRPIQVGPLLHNGEMLRARELLAWPLTAGGYRIGSPNLVTRILAQTNFYPGLIQACGEELVGAMQSRCEGPPLYEITPQIAEEAYRGRGLREFIRGRFQLTLDLDQRYEVIAYAIARLCAAEDDLLVEGLSFARIQDEAREWWEDGFVDSTPERFRSLLDEMEGLGVLRRTGDERWSLRNPNVLLLMGTKDQIEEKLLEEREPVPEFQRETFRGRSDPAKPADPRRSPMTFQQEGRLSAEENGIIVLSGVQAAGYEAALKGLRGSLSSPAVPLWDASDPDSLVETLRAQVAKQKESVRIYVVPHDTEWTGDWIRAARAYLDRLTKSDRWIRLVFPADGPRMFRFLRDEVRTAPWLATILLEPWHDDYLRQWLQDVEILDDPELRRRILEVTGGWHRQLMRFAELVHDGNGEAGIAELDAELEERSERDDLRGQLCLDDFETRAVLRPFAVYGDDGALRRDDAVDEAVEHGLTRDEALRRLKWARKLGLVRAGLTWRINPLVARLIGGEEE